jgi:two-component system cell cycle sensor histidine kinase/response regulator CckA
MPLRQLLPMPLRGAAIFLPYGGPPTAAKRRLLGARPRGEIARDMQEHSEQVQAEEKYRFLAENIRDVIFVQDMDLKVTFVSPSVTLLFGISVDEALNSDLTGYMTPDSYEKGKRDFLKYAALARDAKDVNVPLMEYEYVRKDGSTFWGELKLAFIYDGAANPIGVQGVLRDISARKRMRASLEESGSMFRAIFDLSPQAIALTDVETGRLREVNRKFCELTDFSRGEIVGKTTTGLGFYSEEERHRFLREIQATGTVDGMEMDFRAKGGTVINALMFSKVISLRGENLILSFFLDMTERRRLEAQLRHAQKMEAVGTLAGGMAHDFNNLLQGILGYAQILLLDKNLRDDEYEKIEAIEKIARRGGDLTKRLLVYARKTASRPKPINLNHDIIQACRVLERTLPKMIAIELHLSKDLGLVNCDPGEFEQVIMNLSVNARDAMPEGGKLVFETRNVFLDEEYCKTHPGARKGTYVLLTVSDTGCGIDEKLLDHIFEPFFTTKETGKGTGLGLAMAYGILKAHKGYITCSSAPDNGTTFKIYLPVLVREHPDEQAARRTEEEMPRGTQTILVVDDEEMVRKTTGDILEHFGYSVVLADSGEQALEVCRNRGDEIDLVILDLNMPGVEGHQCMDELLHLNPDMNIIVTSGWLPDVSENTRTVLGSKGFVEKPFKVESLLEAVRNVLEG